MIFLDELRVSFVGTGARVIPHKTELTLASMTSSYNFPMVVLLLFGKFSMSTTFDIIFLAP